MKLTQKISVPANGKTAKTLVLLTVICLVAGLLATRIALNEPQFTEGTKYYIYENIGRGLLVASTLLVFILKDVTPVTYRILLSKTKRAQLDERQRQVRQRIYEKAYFDLLIVALFLLAVPDLSTHTMKLIVGWTIALLAIGLPTMLAAWEKDA